MIWGYPYFWKHPYYQQNYWNPSPRTNLSGRFRHRASGPWFIAITGSPPRVGHATGGRWSQPLICRFHWNNLTGEDAARAWTGRFWKIKPKYVWVHVFFHPEPLKTHFVYTSCCALVGASWMLSGLLRVSRPSLKSGKPPAPPEFPTNMSTISIGAPPTCWNALKIQHRIKVVVIVRVSKNKDMGSPWCPTGLSAQFWYRPHFRRSCRACLSAMPKKNKQHGQGDAWR